jgi:surfeit locus 1 family protein
MKRWLLIAIATFAAAGFIALGAWQVERRTWKLALIERVEQRVHAAPVAAPGPADWRALTRENAEYRHVTLTGRFLVSRETRVRAVTELGEGFWLMAPLQTDDGFVVLVNRGFVPQGWRVTDEAATEAARAGAETPPNAEGAAGTDAPGKPSANVGTVTITGLLRITEPNGALLRSNAPADNRWYSRDVAAISNAQHLSDTAPYFVDAEAAADRAGPDANRPPVPGLTVVHFRNSHLQYAITWFALALMALGLGVRIARNR